VRRARHGGGGRLRRTDGGADRPRRHGAAEPPAGGAGGQPRTARGELMASGSIIVSDRRARFQASPLRHLDPLLIGAPLALAGLGLLMVYSSTHRKLQEAGLDPYDFVKRQGIAIVAGLVAMAVLSAIDYRRLRELALLGYGATVVMLLAVLKIGAD